MNFHFRNSFHGMNYLHTLRDTCTYKYSPQQFEFIFKYVHPYFRMIDQFSHPHKMISKNQRFNLQIQQEDISEPNGSTNYPLNLLLISLQISFWSTSDIPRYLDFCHVLEEICFFSLFFFQHLFHFIWVTGWRISNLFFLPTIFPFQFLASFFLLMSSSNSLNNPALVQTIISLNFNVNALLCSLILPIFMAKTLQLFLF